MAQCTHSFISATPNSNSHCHMLTTGMCALGHPLGMTRRRPTGRGSASYCGTVKRPSRTPSPDLLWQSRRHSDCHARASTPVLPHLASPSPNILVALHPLLPTSHETDARAPRRRSHTRPGRRASIGRRGVESPDTIGASQRDSVSITVGLQSSIYFCQR